MGNTINGFCNNDSVVSHADIAVREYSYNPYTKNMERKPEGQPYDVKGKPIKGVQMKKTDDGEIQDDETTLGEWYGRLITEYPSLDNERYLSTATLITGPDEDGKAWVLTCAQNIV